MNAHLSKDYLRLRWKWTEKSWERKNSDIVLYETHQQLESQRLELCQANQWTDEAQRQNIRLFGELSTKTKSTKNITQEIVEK